VSLLALEVGNDERVTVKRLKALIGEMGQRLPVGCSRLKRLPDGLPAPTAPVGGDDC
jgi:hypothetical protein